MSAGFDPGQFWGLTFRLYQIHMDGVRERIKREAEDRVTQAWLIAKLSRVEKIPKLEWLLSKQDRDPAFIVGRLNALLPSITMQEYLARRANGIVSDRLSEGEPRAG